MIKKGQIISSFIGKYDFLSNFYPCDIEDFSSVEQAYQAAKTLDPIWIQLIREASTPGQAKRLGRKAPMRADWEEIKLAVMEKYLRIKFSNKVLWDRLVSTYPALLIEGNTWCDLFWGMCLCKQCGCKGLNHLGKLLMKIREEGIL